MVDTSAANVSIDIISLREIFSKNIYSLLNGIAT